MPAEPRFVILGASLAGAKAAETLRGEGFGGPVVLIGAERERPYERPPLSKGLLLGKDDKSKIYVHEESWYEQHDVDLRRGITAVAVDRGAHQISLANGEVVGYDKLLITTGASPRRLNVPGGDLDGVLYLRSVGDCERLADAFRSTGQDGGRAVIGGGRLDRPGDGCRRPLVWVRGHGGRAGTHATEPCARTRTRRGVREPAPPSRR